MQNNLQTTGSEKSIPGTSLKTDHKTIQQIQPLDAEHSIGAILVKAGKLGIDKTDSIIRRQQLKKVRFGEAAIQLGLLKEEDVRFALARQYHYPYLLQGDGAASNELVAAYQPFSSQVEVLRALRSQLMLRWFNAPERKTLALISPDSGEGRSYLAANLAIMFSQLGKRTLLIDADMRHPRQHSLFNLQNQTGLSSILSIRSDASSIQQVPSFINLSLLSAGPTPPNPQELLGHPLFSSLLAYTSNKFDVVLVDTPPAIEYADAATIATHCSGALIVTRQDKTRLYETRQMIEGLTQLGVPMVGAVLNRF